MIYLAAGCIALLGFLVIWQSYVFARERAEMLVAFAEERQIWISERRDLNNRIQIPEAAPYLAEDEPGAKADDLPVLPEFTMDEEEMEKAKRELERAGYEEGLVG